MEELIKGLEQINVPIAVNIETKQKCQGKEQIGNYIHIFSGVPKDQTAKRCFHPH